MIVIYKSKVVINMKILCAVINKYVPNFNLDILSYKLGIKVESK